MRTSLATLLLALPLAACGQSTIRQDRAQQQIAQFVEQRTGFHATDVRCPSGVPAKAGGSYDCHFTGPDGPYVAHVRILSVNGTDVRSDIETRNLQNAIRPEASARQISDFVHSHTGYRPVDVNCPQGVRAQAGNTYDCTFTGPDGRYVAHVRILSVNGASVRDDIVTQRVH